MVTASYFVIVALAFWQPILVVCSSSIPSRTITPNATNTFCPLYYTTPIPSPKGYTCGVNGTVTAIGYVSKSCGRAVIDCYRECDNDPRCVSFSLDPYNQICTNYGDRLSNIGFKPSNDVNVLFYDLRGCWVCNQPRPAPKLGCPTTPIFLPPPRENYTCGTEGDVADNKFDQLSIVESFKDCYDLCVALDKLGVCTAFAYRDDGDRSPCIIYEKSLYEYGFKATKNGYMGYNLRGCYDCKLAPTKTCTPTVTPVIPVARNGDFSQTRYNPSYNITQPRYWSGNNQTRSVTGPDGNTYASLFADGNGSGIRPGPTYQAYLYQNETGFDFNPGSPGRFYNYSFDLAIPLHWEPPGKPKGCVLSAYFTEVDIFLADPKYGPSFKTIGPFLVDVSKKKNYLFSSFNLGCHDTSAAPLDNSTSLGNGTVLIDNVVWSQHGLQVGQN